METFYALWMAEKENDEEENERQNEGERKKGKHLIRNHLIFIVIIDCKGETKRRTKLSVGFFFLLQRQEKGEEMPIILFSLFVLIGRS